MMQMRTKEIMMRPHTNQHLWLRHMNYSFNIRYRFGSGYRISTSTPLPYCSSSIIIQVYYLFMSDSGRPVKSFRCKPDSDKHNLRYTKYNMTFRPSEVDLAANNQKTSRSSHDHDLKVSKSCDTNTNFTFTRYSFFPAHIGRHQRQHRSLIQQPTRHQYQPIKWVGVKGIEYQQDDKHFCQRNAFPQRKKKDSNQLIINMLMKYQKHFGRGDELSINLQSEDRLAKKYFTKREKRFQARVHWFKGDRKSQFNE